MAIKKKSKKFIVVALIIALAGAVFYYFKNKNINNQKWEDTLSGPVDMTQYKLTVVGSRVTIDGRGDLTGQLSSDGKRIDWSNGTTWKRI